jgi:hypothetical protein
MTAVADEMVLLVVWRLDTARLCSAEAASGGHSCPHWLQLQAGHCQEVLTPGLQVAGQ